MSVAMKGDGHGRVELMNGYLTLRLRKQLRPSLHFSNPLTHRVELQTRKRDPSKHLNVPTTTTLTHAPPSSALHPRTRRSLKPTQPLLGTLQSTPNFCLSTAPGTRQLTNPPPSPPPSQTQCPNTSKTPPASPRPASGPTPARAAAPQLSNSPTQRPKTKRPSRK